MKRNVLLVEPGYKTKFPPLGLMKISAYHKMLGDNVHFVKGINHDTAYEYWDKIYITTLFTYYWKVTIETIKYYKNLVRDDISRICVGGIMASLMPQELWNETGIAPIQGVLNTPGMLGDDNNHIVDNMIPDYLLFDDSDERYALLDSYFGYSTRGCVNKCGFCGVPILEPKFIDYKGIKPYINKIDKLYGTKQDLVLFDNNILASKKFQKIKNDILDLGFEKGSKRDNKLRHVDFNQGVDARLLQEENCKLLSKIAISPLRIAFDHIKYEKIYRKCVLLAAKNKIRNLSNYILYNYDDTPEDLWKRLKITIDLNKKYDLKIYSFPMKYIPINAKDRSFINEPRWNWQFIRNVQRILNVLKGSVMTSEDFFYRAFGETTEEFMTILHMPENILMYRSRTPQKEEKDWIRKFKKLNEGERKDLLTILCENKTKDSLVQAVVETKNKKLKSILQYYLREPSQLTFDMEYREESYHEN